MPRVSPDTELAAILSAFLRERHEGNKSAAGRALGVPRPLFYRALRGTVTKSTAARLLRTLHANDFPIDLGRRAGHSSGDEIEMPELALHLLRFMTKAVQEHVAHEGRIAGA